LAANLVPNRFLSQRGSWGSGQYTAGLQYQYNPDTMFFVTVAQGHRSGGISLTAPVGFEQWEPETLTNIEGGVKTTFNVGDWLFRTNVSGFYGFYDDIIASVTQAVQVNPPPAPKSLQVVNQNAATARVRGVDFDWTVIPTDWLEVGGFIAYTNNKYTEWMDIDGQGNPVDLSGTPFSFTPKVKWSLRGTYTFPIDRSWGDVSLSSNLTHTGKMFNVAKPPNRLIETRVHTAANGYGPLAADGRTVAIDRNPSYYNLDLTLNWRDINGINGLSGAVAVTNVTKNTQNDGGCYCEAALGLTAEIPQIPRMFTVRLRYDF
jgi:outer membrane receptor protein involved in Fe transport